MPKLEARSSEVARVDLQRSHFGRRSLFGVGLAVFVLRPPLHAVSAPAQVPEPGLIEQRLREHGIELPKFVPVAGINNVPYARAGNLVFVSGVGPRTPDGGFATGKVGKDVTVEEAYQRARNTGLTVLSIMRAAVGSLDNVSRVVKVFGMVNATPEFTDHPRVINGCSDLFVEIFGERGRHARSAVGMASLPFGLTVEIDAVFEVV